MKKLIFFSIIILFFMIFLLNEVNAVLVLGLGNATSYSHTSNFNGNDSLNSAIYGIIIKPDVNIWIYGFNKSASDYSTRGILKNISTSPAIDINASTCTFVGNYCKFPIPIFLKNNTQFGIVTDANGVAVDRHRKDSGVTFPQQSTYFKFNMTYIAGQIINTDVYTIQAINITNIQPSIFDVLLIDPIGSSNVNHFNGTLISTGNINFTNATLWIYYGNGSLFNNTITNIVKGNGSNATNFISPNLSLANWKWNIFGCANATVSSCDFALENATFDYGYKLNARSFFSPVASLSTTSFILNITTIFGLSSSTAFLNYNKSVFSSAKESIGGNEIYTVIIDIPAISSSITKDFNWTIVLIDSLTTFRSNTSTQSQNISLLNIDDCSINNITILNYTLRDEGTQNFLTVGSSTNSTIEIELILSSINNPLLTTIFNATYTNKNPASICIAQNVLNNSAFRLDAIARYVSTNRISEFHNIQNFSFSNSTILQNINLFDLLTTDSQEFLITFKDQNLLPVNNALIDITRKYIGEAVFKSIEIPKTNIDGQTLGHLVLSDVIYTIIVSKDGKILGTFNNIVAFCNDLSSGDCQINLNALTTSINPEDFSRRNNLTYLITFDKLNRIVQSIFSTTDGSSALITLNVTQFNAYNNQTLCSNILSTSSGILSCTIPESFGNVTALARLYKDGIFIADAIFKISPSPQTIFGGERVILLFLLFVTLPLMMISNLIGIIFMGIIALIIAGLLNIYESGSFIGLGSTMLWFIVAGSILIWKISRRES